ncbi:MAG: metallophosphoesterase family protein [Akkermansiaceae bacterium]
MRYAIVSDIHANLRAWEAVLADIRSQQVDVIVCLGDVVGYGPKPAEVLEAVRSATDHFVLGNHDAAAVGMMDYSIFNDHARQAIEWTRTELSPEQKQFLSSVPLAIEAGEILFVHAEIAEPGRFDYIDSVEIAKENFEANEHFVTFVGHTHLPKMFELSTDGSVQELLDTTSALDSQNRYIINVGSVGEPRNPDDLSSRYAIYDVEKREIDFRHVEFDIVAYRQDLESTTLALRPYFLRVYEQVVEGREVVVSNGGSLVDMQVSHDSAALVDLGRVSTMVQLGSPGSMLASAQPSRTPLYALAAAAVLTVAALIFWGTRDSYPSPTENQNPAITAKDEPPAKKKPEKEPKITSKGNDDGSRMVSSNLPKKKDPLAIKNPEPKEPEPAPAKPEEEPDNPERETVAQIDKDKIDSIWWRMNKEDAEGVLTDNSGLIKLLPLRSGKGTRPIAPDPVPLNQEANDSALILGIWQEEKPKGIFALSSEKSFTFEGWFIADKLRRPVFLLGTRTGDGEDNRGWHIDLRPPARGSKEDQMAFFYDSGTKRIQALAESVKVADKEPHHFAIIWNHEASDDKGEMKLFLDGTEVASATVVHSDIPGEQISPLRLGGPGNRTPLALDELCFTPKVLQSHEFLLKTPVLGATLVKSKSTDRDSWAVPENWEGGQLPGPTDNVIIEEGLSVQVQDSPPEPYSGSLVLKRNATLTLWAMRCLTALPKSPSFIEMHQGARLILRSGEASFGPIHMIEDGTIYGGQSTNGHGSIRHFKGEIKGDGKLTINGVSRNQIRIEATNTFTGGFMAHSSQNQSFFLVATCDSAFGTGDVEIRDKASLVIEPRTKDVIADTATLRLEGAGSLRVNGPGAQAETLYKLVLNSNEAVGGFYIDGEDQGEGVFSSETHSGIAGSGKLTVKKP